MAKNPLIAAAITIAGSQPRLAERSGISQQHISKMLNGERRVTAEAAVGIERATDKAVPRWRLRPDLWDAPESVMREAV